MDRHSNTTTVTCSDLARHLLELYTHFTTRAARLGFDDKQRADAMQSAARKQLKNHGHFSVL